MIVFALSPLCNDFFAVGGFVVGVVGFVVTIWQIVKTKRAIVASREAAAQTFEESRNSFERFMGGYAYRLVSELQNFVNAKEWKLAKLRAQDIAELLATLRDSRDPSIVVVEEMRQLVHMLAEKSLLKRVSINQEKFRALLSQVQARLDSLRAPFRE